VTSAAPEQRPPNRRGSPEAVEKRRVARRFNALLGPALATRGNARRRRRLLDDLRAGSARGRPLKPIDVLRHVQQLLDMGADVSEIAEASGDRYRGAPHPAADIVGALRRLHAAYGFRAECYPFVGVSRRTLAAAGIVRAAQPTAVGENRA
jgi:hypothetical protein